MLLRDDGEPTSAALLSGLRDLRGTGASCIAWEAKPGGLTVAVTPGWTAFTGQSSEDARGFGWTRCVHPDDRDRILAIIHQAKAEGQGYRFEYRVRRVDRVYRWMAALGTPVDDRGTYVGMVADITAQRAREEQARGTSTLVSVPEAARILGVSAAHLYRLARSAAPPPFVTRLGRVVRVDLAQFYAARSR